MDPFRPGELTSSQAAALNRLARDVARLAGLRVAPPLGLDNSAGNPVLSLAQQPVWARITGKELAPSGGSSSGSGASSTPDPWWYSWVQINESELDTPLEDVPSPVGKAGYADRVPAVEVNTSEVVETGTKVRLHPTPAGRHWLFAVSGGSGGGSDSSFLAVLTYKTYADPFVTYSWREVEETGFPGSPLVYTTTAVTSDDDGTGPAYEEDNRDLPVLPTISPATTGDPGPGVSVDQLCVVRLRRQTPAAGGIYYLFEREPWADLFRRTGISDEYGEIAYHRYWDGSGWQDGREVRLVSVE